MPTTIYYLSFGVILFCIFDTYKKQILNGIWKIIRPIIKYSLACLFFFMLGGFDIFWTTIIVLAFYFDYMNQK